MIIGLIGFAGSGKGTAADFLVQKHNFTKLAFADAVKDATSAIFGWPRHLLEGDTEESRKFRETKDEWWSERFEYDFSPRIALQLMGTEAGRDVFHPDLWIHALSKKLSMYPNVVIADVRFPNEIVAIRNMGGFIVRIKRGDDPEWYGDALFENTSKNRISGVNVMEKMHPQIHYSEWAWIGTQVDYHLDNIGAVSMLENDIDHMIKVFTGPKNPATIAA
jgi:hypothetical protein